MKKYIKKISYLLKAKGGVFFTFHMRPAYSDFINRETEAGGKDTAIIIQGPIIRERSFTLETVKTYIKIFPGTHIIISTWSNENMLEFEDLDIEILLNEKPEQPGISNINYQIVSTYNGLMAAKKLNVAYLLKTRTDQRIYNEKSITYFKDLLRIFPINRGLGPKGRIIITDMNTFKYRPYSVSDFMLFGFTEDVINYWDTKRDTRTINKYEYKNVLEWSQLRLCEVFLSANYFEKLGEKLNWSMSDSWQKYVNYFCIADRATIDLYWFKYEKNIEYRHKNYDGNFMNEEFCFVDWLKLYNSKNFDTAHEHLLAKQIEDKI